MLLSIGMIVKNEEKYLDKCLSALVPILKNVDSELIIADTGSTDKTVEIAKKYTDNVFYFEWINDFAAARNSTLEKAKGEWYLYIDADEIFQSCDEIINFFLSGEYKNYNSASYIIRNYLDSSNWSAYTDFNARRFRKIIPGIKFTGCIHEALNAPSNPEKILTDIAGHYGYIFNDKKVKDEKAKRNTELLLKRLETETPTPKLYLQLYDSFFINNPDEAVKYAEKGLEIVDKRNNLATICLYSSLIYYHQTKGNHEKVLELCDEYFTETAALHSGRTLCTDADIYFYRAKAFFGLGKFNEEIEAFEKFFSLYFKIESGKLFTKDIAISPLRAALKGNLDYAVFVFIFACIRTGKYELAAEYLKKFNINDYYINNSDLRLKIEHDFIIMRCTNNYGRTQALYNHLDENGRTMLKVFVRKEAEIENPSPEVNDLFRKIFKNEPDFARLLDTVKEHFLSGNCLENAKKLSVEGLCTYHEILYYLLAEKQDISLITALEKYNFKSAVNFCSDAFEDFYEVLENYPIENISQNGLRGTLNLLEAAMELSLRENRDIEALFSLWGMTGLAVCEAENLGAEELSGQLFGAVMAAEAISEKSQGNFKNCLNALTALVRQYPAAKPFVPTISDKIQKQTQPMNEMEALAAEFKKNIRMLIANGEIQQAGQLLSEYEKIMPGDPEIDSLKNQIF